MDENVEQLLFVANALPALICYVDADGRYVWANESYGRWFGTPSAPIHGLHVKDVLGAAAWAAISSYVERALAGEEVTFTQRLVYKNGPPRDIRATYVPHIDASGHVRGFAGLINDVTEIKAAEQALLDASRRKDEFLAMLSHELRNPLAPILSAVELLGRAGPGDEKLTSKYHAVIARQVQHMKRLLDDLLDVSRVSQGKIELRKEPLDLDTLLLQAVEVSRPLIVEKRQDLSVMLASGRLPLLADPTRLVQVFANLINNAAKYTNPGGHITLSATVEEGAAVVRVRDDGVGMSPELLEQAFDLFVQETRSLDRAQGGLGIGLTMVRTLVKLHGGSVHALSDGPGRGSEFVVTLPLSSGAQTTGPRDAPVADEPSPQPPLHVLVVDDNVDAARALGQLLDMLGHHVRVAHDGPGALASAAAEPPDLVLLDIGLPGMDGYAVAAELRGVGHDRAGLIALSGYGDEEHLHRASEAGFDRHITKPVDFVKLMEVIAQLRRG